MSRSRTFVITYNNPTITLDEFQSLCKSIGCITLSAQLEKGEAGTPHIQAYLAFKDALTIKSLSKKLPKSHIEVSRNPIKSYEYCQKTDTRIEGPVIYGEAPKPRKNIAGDTLAFN